MRKKTDPRWRPDANVGLPEDRPAGVPLSRGNRRRPAGP